QNVVEDVDFHRMVDLFVRSGYSPWPLRGRGAGIGSRPTGAMDCSHGGSEVRRQADRAQPGEGGVDSQSCPTGAEEFYCRAAAQSDIPRPFGAKTKNGSPASTGSASAGCAAPPLHLWLQPAAPFGDRNCP